MMRIVDTVLSIPVLFLLIVIAAILKPSFWLIVFIVALAAWLVPARLDPRRDTDASNVASTSRQCERWGAVGAGS